MTLTESIALYGCFVMLAWLCWSDFNSDREHRAAQLEWYVKQVDSKVDRLATQLENTDRAIRAKLKKIALHVGQHDDEDFEDDFIQDMSRQKQDQ